MIELFIDIINFDLIFIPLLLLKTNLSRLPIYKSIIQLMVIKIAVFNLTMLTTVTAFFISCGSESSIKHRYFYLPPIKPQLFLIYPI